MNKMIRKNNNNNNNKNKRKQIVGLKSIKGRGDYSMDMRKMKNTISDIATMLKPTVKQALLRGGGVMGAGAATAFGAPEMALQGRKIGTMLGAKLSKLIGSGDYTSNDTMKNSLIGTKGDAYASFNTGNKSIRIQHREYLQDIISPSVAFNLESYPINPGLPFCFPYLSNIALNFEEYRVRGLVYEYVSTATPYSTTPNMGAVIMSMEYNTANSDYSSKAQMENSDFAVSAPPYKNIIYGVECDRNVQNAYYVRSSASTLPGPLTDLGTFFIATQGVAAGTVGELWCSYDIEFLRPRASGARFGLLNITRVSATSIGSAGATIKSATGAFTSTTISAAGVITFPDAIIGDVYKIIVSVASTGTGNPSATAVYTGFTSTTNGPFIDANGAITSGIILNSASKGLLIETVVVTGLNPTFAVSTAALVGSSHSTQIIVDDLGGNLLRAFDFGV